MTILKKPEWFFYPAWIILTTLSIPLAFALGLVILGIITDIVGDYIYVDGVRHITEDYLGRYILVPLAGLFMGGLQYGLLRRYLPRMGWWVLATAGSWLLLMIFDWLTARMSESFDINGAFIMLGLSVGVGQWLLLRRRLPRASWWIGANGVGWGLLSLVTGGSIGLMGVVVLGFLPACVTALTLTLLISQAQPN